MEIVTSDKLHKKKKQIEIKLDERERKQIEEHKKKEKAMRGNFEDALTKLITKIKEQKDIVLHNYGPLLLKDKKEDRPIFELDKD